MCCGNPQHPRSQLTTEDFLILILFFSNNRMAKELWYCCKIQTVVTLTESENYAHRLCPKVRIKCARMLSRSEWKTALWFRRTAICRAGIFSGWNCWTFFNRWALSQLHRCWNISIAVVSLSVLHEMHVQGERLWNNNLVTTSILYTALTFEAFLFYPPNQCASLANVAAQFGKSSKWPFPACNISELARLSSIPPTPARFCSGHRAAWQDMSKSDFVVLRKRLDVSSPSSLLADRLAESGGFLSELF